MTQAKVRARPRPVLLALRHRNFGVGKQPVQMFDSPESGLFSLLPARRPPWKEFLLSSGVQATALFVIAWIAILHPEVIAPPEHDYHFVQLVNTPPPVNHEPASLRVIQP